MTFGCQVLNMFKFVVVFLGFLIEPYLKLQLFTEILQIHPQTKTLNLK